MNKTHNVVHCRPKKLQFFICECCENMVLKSIYDTVFIFPYAREWLFLNTAWLDEAYLMLQFLLLLLKELRKLYCFLRNCYFMPVSTNKVCGFSI
jgi:hypothetical protein